MKDYFSFRKLIAPGLIRSYYIVGALALTIAGFWLIFDVESKPTLPLTHTFWYLLGILVGNVAWRVLCESWILFFNIHDSIVSIQDSQVAFAAYLQSAQRKQQQRRPQPPPPDWEQPGR